MWEKNRTAQERLLVAVPLEARTCMFFLRSCRELQSIESKRPLDSRKIESVGAEHFEIAQLVPQAKFMVRLQLVAVTRPADALKVFSVVWIATP